MDAIYFIISHNLTHFYPTLQENLPRELQEQIINELRPMHKLTEAMDAIEIILVFVSSGGAKADKNLGEYAERALKMDKQFCSVVSCRWSLHPPFTCSLSS